MTRAANRYLPDECVLPYRGSWLDFEFDAKDHVYVRIDRRRKLPATTLLLALYDQATEGYLAECAAESKTPDRAHITGMTKEEVLSYFYDINPFRRTANGWATAFAPNRFKGGGRLPKAPRTGNRQKGGKSAIAA